MVATEVGRQGNLQVVAYHLAAGGDFLGDIAQPGQRQAGGRQQAFAFARQAQAARRAQHQRHAQFAFQPFQAGAGQRRRQVELAGGGGQAAEFGGADEDLEVGQAADFHLIFESVSIFSQFIH